MIAMTTMISMRSPVPRLPGHVPAFGKSTVSASGAGMVVGGTGFEPVTSSV